MTTGHDDREMTEPAPPGTPSSRVDRLLHSTIVAVLATLLVQGSAFLSAASFDRLPMFLDVVLVMFVYPFAWMLAVLLFDAKVLTRLVPRWLHRADGREADHPTLLMFAVLLASVTSIYPGMFPYRTFVHLKLDGAALDVRASEVTRGDAAYYRFRDATLRGDLGGGLTRDVIVRESGISKTIQVTTFVAPIVDSGWTPGQPVRFWSTNEADIPPWAGDAPPLRGLRNDDERHHAQRAVDSVAAAAGLTLAEEPILVTLGEPWETELERSRFRSWVVLLLVGVFVFLVTWLSAWKTLGHGAD